MFTSEQVETLESLPGMGGDIHTKLAAIAGKVGPINKDERNKEQGFAFRSIEAITGAVRPLFAAEGVSIAPKMLSVEHSEVIAKSGARGFRTIVHMQYTFTAGSDGSFIETSMVGEAVDYGDKSASKAVQMAYKYVLTQVLQVGSGDDPDSQSIDVGEQTPFDVVAYTRDAVQIFGEWSDKERAEAFKTHAQTLLGGKATTAVEVRQVIQAMSEGYYKAFPDQAPF